MGRCIEAVLTCTHNLCFEQKYEKNKKISTEIVIFTAVKNRCILHGCVFVMKICSTDLISGFTCTLA